MASGTGSGGVDPLIGRTLAGRYRIEGLLGRGGMGAVYAAQHVKIGRPVALKVLGTQLSEDASQVERFNQEARASSRLEHPNTIRVFDYGQSEDGQLYIAMERLEGRELSRVIREDGFLEPGRAVRVARQIVKSIGEAHQAGVIHRDLKPDNVFLCNIYGETDFVKVLDFGIAKFTDGSPDQHALTQTGFIPGTPLYIAPEHALGQDVSGRTDLYSLGVMLYEMLTGAPPFRADTPLRIVMKHIHEAPPPLRDKKPDLQVPPELEALVFQLLSKRPSERPASAEAVGEALDSLDLEGSAAPRSRRFKDFGDSHEEATVLSGAAMDLEATEATPGQGRRAVAREPTPAPMPGPVRRSGSLPSVPRLRAPEAGVPAETGAIGVGQGPPQRPRAQPTSPWAVAGAVLAAVVVILGGGVTLWFTAGPGAADEEPARATVGAEPSGSETADAPEDTPEQRPLAIQEDSPAPAAAPLAEGGEDEQAEVAGDEQAGAGAGDDPLAEEAPPAVVEVEIRTTPEGAEILDGEEQLGEAPLAVPVPADGTRTLTVRLEGHEDQLIEVAADAEAPVRVALEPEPPAPKPRAREPRKKRRPSAGDRSSRGGGSEPVWTDWDE